MSDHPLSNITADAFRKAAVIRDQIETLEGQLQAILTGASAPVKVAGKRAYKKRGPKPGSKNKAAKRKGGRRQISPEGRERIRQAQLKRWANQKRGKKA